MKLIFVFLFSIAVNSNYAIGQNFTKDELLSIVTKSNPVLRYSTKRISKQVKIAYRNKFNTILVLSNPGTAYNTTDVIYKNEPFGMLLFAGTETDNVGFLLFESKGITSQCFFVYYKLKGRKVSHMESVTLKKQPTDFEDLKRVLNEKAYF